MKRFLVWAILVPVWLWIVAALTVLLVGWLADCRIDEVAPQSCHVAGLEVGATLYALGVVAAWGPLVLIPFAAMLGIGWVVVAGIRALLGRRS